MENDGGRAEKRGKKGRQNGSRQPFKTSNRLGLGGRLSHVTGPPLAAQTIKHRRQAMTSKSTSGHDKYHQNQASKVYNKMTKCSGTPQIPSKSRIEGKQWLAKVPPATTNTIKVKHTIKTIPSKSMSGHHKYHQNQSSKKSNVLQKCVRPPQIASNSNIECKQ